MNASLKRLLNHDGLRAMAGAATFERGRIYAAEGRVTLLSATEEKVVARVRGGEDYEVRLWLKGRELQYACECPFAAEGAFCKHCVAAGLAASDGAS
jgi:uncharacterized Zn finger protein